MTGDILRARLTLWGFRPCKKCKQLLRIMNRKPPQWSEEHKQKIARRINNHLMAYKTVRSRMCKAVPTRIRHRYLVRQIEIAVKLAGNQRI